MQSQENDEPRKSLPWEEPYRPQTGILIVLPAAVLYRLLWIVVKVAHKNLSGSTSVLFENLAKENRYCSRNLHAADSRPDLKLRTLADKISWSFTPRAKALYPVPPVRLLHFKEQFDA